MDEKLFIPNVKLLMKQGLYDSAKILLNFLKTSQKSKDPSKKGVKHEAEIFYLEGLLHAKKKEWKRALNCYNLAIAHAVKETNPLVNSVPAQTPTTCTNGGPSVADIRYKIAQIYMELKEEEKAIKELKAIPAHQRSIAALLLLAKLYKDRDSKQNATSCYREILKRNPLAIEAAIELVKIDSTSIDVIKLIKTHASQQNVQQENMNTKIVKRQKTIGSTYPNNTGAALNSCLPWLDPLLEGHYYYEKHLPDQALKYFSFIEKNHKDNLYVYLMMSFCQVQVNEISKCKYTLEKSRQIDRFNLEGMDLFAHLLKMEGDALSLNRLSTELLSISPIRPEPWLAIAMYYDLIGQKKKALSLIERALDLDANYRMGYLLKGNLCLSTNDAQGAAACFRRALVISKSLAAYAGLIKSCLQINGKFNEALMLAKEAQKLCNPPRAIALTLLGQVLAQHPGAGKVKAREYLNEAIKQEPSCWEAIQALVGLDVAEEKYVDAAARLENALNNGIQPEQCHIRLAEVLVHTGKKAEAMLHYHKAKILNPNSERVLKGIEALEKPDDVGEDESEDQMKLNEESDGDEVTGDPIDESMEDIV